MKLLVKVKGGSGSGNWGHTGRPGLRGGSGGSGGFIAAPEDWTWDVGATTRMADVMVETEELYGNPSDSEVVDAWTSADDIWYGDNKYKGGWNPLAKGFQEEILASSIPQAEILYRGVFGDHAKKLGSLQVGDELVLRRFSSTSRSVDVASSFRRLRTGVDSVMLSIRAGKGMPGLYAHKLASEIVLPAYSTFDVVGKTGNTIHLEYTGVEDPYA